MTVCELARMLREIEIKEFTEPDLMSSEHESYDELPNEMQNMYKKFATVYLSYFNMERKND